MTPPALIAVMISPSSVGLCSALKCTGSTTPSIGSQIATMAIQRNATVRSTLSFHRNDKPSRVERTRPCSRACAAGRPPPGIRVRPMSSAESPKAIDVAQNVVVAPTEAMRMPPMPGPSRNAKPYALSWMPFARSRSSLAAAAASGSIDCRAVKPAGSKTDDSAATTSSRP